MPADDRDDDATVATTADPSTTASPPPAPRLFRFSTYAHKKASPQTMELPWEDFLYGGFTESIVVECTLADGPDKCQGPKCEHKSAVPAWSMGTFGICPEQGRPRRLKKLAIAASVVGLDLDHGRPEDAEAMLVRLRASGVAGLVHGTHTDGVGGERRLRAILRPSRDIAPAEWPAFVRGACKKLEIPFADESTFDISRLLYLPTRSKDAPERYFEVLPGDGDLNVEECVALGEPLLKKKRRREDGPVVADVARLGDGAPLVEDPDAEIEGGTPADEDLLAVVRDHVLRVFGPAVEGAGGTKGGIKALYLGTFLFWDLDLPWSQGWPIVLEWDKTCTPPWMPDEEDDLRGKLKRGTEVDLEGPRGGRRTEFAANAVIFRWVRLQREAKEIEPFVVGVDGPATVETLTPTLEGDDDEDPSVDAEVAVVDGERPPARLKPTIHIDVDVEAMADRAMEVLADDPEDDRRIYQRGGALVQIGTDRRRARGGKIVMPVIKDAKVAAIKSRLSALARWLGADAKGNPKTLKPDKDAVERVVDGPSWPVPLLVGLAECPIVRPDGSVRLRAGYDEETGIYLASSPLLDAIRVPETPGLEDAREAYAVLADIFSEYPFVREHHLAAAVSYLCTVVCRSAVVGCVPFFGVNAPQPNSGKSLLVDIVAAVGMGTRSAQRMALSTDEEERKQIDSILFAGLRTAMIDNVARPFGSEQWDKLASTPGDHMARVMGGNEMRAVAALCVWAITGNHLTVSDKSDFAKRIVIVDIDPKMEKPGDRKFRRPMDALIDHCLANRARLIGAALTLVRAYALAGRPGVREPSSTYGSWNRVIRGAVEWASGLDPWGGQEDFARDNDPRAEAERAFLTVWASTLKDNVKSATEVVAVADSKFRTALEGILPKDSKVSVQAVGNRLSRLKGKTMGIGGRAMRLESVRSDVARGWVLREV